MRGYWWQRLEDERSCMNLLGRIMDLEDKVDRKDWRIEWCRIAGS
jgi:hypothetical protein